MKISVDCACIEKLFEVSETQMKVIANDIPEDVLDTDLKRRLKYILMHKYERCFDRLKRDWEPKLADSGFTSLPTNKDEFAQLVFAQPDYKDRSARDVETAAKNK